MMRAYRLTVVIADLTDYRMTVCEISIQVACRKDFCSFRERKSFFCFISVCNKKKRGKTMKEKTQNAGRGASLAMGVAFVGFTTQFGLIPLVKTGYSYIGYATLIVIVIPFIVHMIVGCVKKQPVMGSEAAEN
ncbi:MAG: hypothetical protein ACLRLP_04780 [Lachnospira sp.]|jgi:hypothetical protein